MSANTTLSVPTPGVLANDSSNGGGPMTAARDIDVSSGVLVLNPDGSFTYTPNTGFSGTDRFTYHAVNAYGPSNQAIVTLTVTAAMTPQPPTDLIVDSVKDQLVTLRFNPPTTGPAPTGYVLKGGLFPNEVLASIPTGSTAPIFTFLAPNGSFFIRMHTLVGGAESGPSNEIRLHVNVPVTPSSPVLLTGLVNGSTLGLEWKNTFQGGPATGVVLDVTGSVTAVLPLGPSERFSFTGVPAGTYTLAVRATNGGGSSPPSNPVTLAFPGPCSGTPEMPERFLAYKLGSTVFVLWDPPALGPAPTGYVVHVTGAFVGAIPTPARALSGTVGPGSYGLSVQATNPCGASAVTPEQVVVVP